MSEALTPSTTPDQPQRLAVEPGSLSSVLRLIQSRKSARQVQFDQYVDDRELTPEQAEKDGCCNYWKGGVAALNEIEITIERWMKHGMDTANA
jgi:hypothetical protein